LSKICSVEQSTKKLAGFKSVEDGVGPGVCSWKEEKRIKALARGGENGLIQNSAQLETSVKR